jgi:uncharacterized membrane protein YczE
MKYLRACLVGAAIGVPIGVTTAVVALLIGDGTSQHLPPKGKLNAALNRNPPPENI